MSAWSKAADAYFYVAMPSCWPVEARRAFLLTFPVSVPALLLWWLALPVAGAAAMFVGTIVLALLWIAYPVIRLIEVARDLWSES